MNFPEFMDLTGQRFGRLVVLEREPSHVTPSGQRKTVWLCRCDCGNLVKVKTQELRRGKTKSCGCYRLEFLEQCRTKHHGAKTRLYNIYNKMKRRCENPNDAAYKDYGGRGITVCEEWKNDFTVFREWALLNGYDDSLSIDRIDNSKGYCPENCRWATSKQQSNNRRSNLYILYNGEVHTLSEWSDILGIKYGHLQEAFHKGEWGEEFNERNAK